MTVDHRQDPNQVPDARREEAVAEADELLVLLQGSLPLLARGELRRTRLLDFVVRPALAHEERQEFVHVQRFQHAVLPVVWVDPNLGGRHTHAVGQPTRLQELQHARADRLDLHRAIRRALGLCKHRLDSRSVLFGELGKRRDPVRHGRYCIW